MRIWILSLGFWFLASSVFSQPTDENRVVEEDISEEFKISFEAKFQSHLQLAQRFPSSVTIGELVDFYQVDLSEPNAEIAKEVLRNDFKKVLSIISDHYSSALLGKIDFRSIVEVVGKEAFDREVLRMLRSANRSGGVFIVFLSDYLRARAREEMINILMDFTFSMMSLQKNPSWTKMNADQSKTTQLFLKTIELGLQYARDHGVISRYHVVRPLSRHFIDSNLWRFFSNSPSADEFLQLAIYYRDLDLIAYDTPPYSYFSFARRTFQLLTKALKEADHAGEYLFMMGQFADMPEDISPEYKKVAVRAIQSTLKDLMQKKRVLPLDILNIIRLYFKLTEENLHKSQLGKMLDPRTIGNSTHLLESLVVPLESLMHSGFYAKRSESAGNFFSNLLESFILRENGKAIPAVAVDALYRMARIVSPHDLVPRIKVIPVDADSQFIELRSQGEMAIADFIGGKARLIRAVFNRCRGS